MPNLSKLVLPVLNQSTGVVTNETFDIKGSGGSVKGYSETLAAGSTSVTFQGIETTANTLVQFGTSVANLDYNSVTISNESTSGGVTTADYTVTYDAQGSAITVYLVLIDDVSSASGESESTTTVTIDSGIDYNANSSWSMVFKKGNLVNIQLSIVCQQKTFTDMLKIGSIPSEYRPKVHSRFGTAMIYDYTSEGESMSIIDAFVNTNGDIYLQNLSGSFRQLHLSSFTYFIE